MRERRISHHESKAVTSTKMSNLTEWLRSLEGMSIEEMKRNVATRLAESERNTATLRDELTNVSKECEDQEQTLENLSDMDTAVQRVLTSLDEHIKTLKLNENSLAVNQSILQYEAAKTRATALRKCISGRKQYEKAWEMMKEVPKEDHATVLTTLQELQSSIDVIKNCVPKASVNKKELDNQKDTFLAWQSTAFFLALQQGDTGKVAEIYNTYASLDRKKEFIAIFSKGIFNRFSHAQVDRSSVHQFFEGISREIETQLNMFFSDSSVLAQKEFLDANECLQLVTSAIRLALTEYDLTAASQELLKSAPDSIKFLDDLNKSLSTMYDSIPQNYTEYVRDTASDLYDFLRQQFLSRLEVPLSETIIEQLQTRVSGMDLVSFMDLIKNSDLKFWVTGSHRTKISSFISTVNEVVLILHDILVSLSNVYPADGLNNIIQKPIDKVFDEFLDKIKNWTYSKDSQGKTRSIDEIIKVCEASGHFIAGITRLKTIASGIHESLSVPTRGANKWNARVCDTTLQLVSAQMCSEVQRGVNELVLATTTGNAPDLPSFSLTPSEYMTGVAQEVLQHFHKFEMFLADENTAHAFTVWSKGGEGEEDLLMRIMRDMCNISIRSFVQAIGETSTLTPTTIKQLRVDAEYFREVLLDLRLPSPLLDEYIAKLTT
ncbi:unnamed protein product, partial [Mesorhabditis belari]|uniref:Conserved oligomeric Golgi complex subunit 7 n=1 Tax=Mesorhabditis belari TaxID=2138241 RepID=A0AAF3ENR2_9BILA